MMNYNDIKPIIKELKVRTKKEAFSIKICNDRVPDLRDSKLGGIPYWDIEKEYPVDSQGKKLMLLAQINLEQYDFGQRLPGKGMLQFFTGLDDVFGMDFDEQDKPDTFRVIYHETINDTITKEAVMSLGVPTNLEEILEEYTPVTKEYALEFTKKEVYLGECDYRFEPLFREIAKEIGIDLQEEENLYNLMDDEVYEQMIEELSNTGHWLLGYPFFTQTDPRQYNEKYSYYDTVLFQLDSDYDKENGDLVLWGDCGVGNFFINSEDLKNRKFDKILYNWDCC